MAKMRVIKTLLRKRWSALVLAVFLGVVVSLLPAIVTREGAALCPCHDGPKDLERTLSRQKREEYLQYITRREAAVGPIGLASDERVDQNPWTDRLFSDAGRIQTDGPKDSKMNNTSLSGSREDLESKIRLSQEKNTPSSPTVNSNRSDCGHQKASSEVQIVSSDTNIVDASGNVPAFKTDLKLPLDTMAEMVMDALLDGSFSKAQQLNIQLFSGLEWFGEDAIVKKNPTAFALNTTNARYRPVPKLLQGQENGCGKEPPFLLVFVPSVAKHNATRKVIRNTWAGPAYGKAWPRGVNITHKVKVVFVFGLTDANDTAILTEEQAKYGDIVRADFVDSYQNLTIKMIVSLHWNAYYCPGAQFFMKVDEDTFVNIPLLLNLLTLVSKRHDRFIMGYRNTMPVVLRTGKWKVETSDYPLSMFPAYVIGHSYVITGNVIKAMAYAASYVTVVPIEDAYVTGIMAEVLGIPRIHAASFAEADRHANICEVIRGRYVSQTRFNANSLTSLWKVISSKLCGEWSVYLQ